MALLVLAYPKLSKNDFELIQNFRKGNDKLFHAVEPHFTLVFPVFDINNNDFIKEIKTQSKSLTEITFAIRCSTIKVL